MATKKKMLQAAAGNAGGGGDVLNVEDVFSTYLYEGNGSDQKITNGISLGDSPTDGVYYLSSPSSVTGNNSALGVSATIDGTVSLNSSDTKFATNSYDFDGASNIRLSSALIDTSSSFCFETWVYFDSTGNSGDMAMLLAQYKSGENGRLLFGAQSGNLVIRYNGSSTALTASVSASTWLHVAWSYDGTTHRLFVNGNLEDSTTLDFPIYTGVTTQLGGTDPTLLSGYDLDGKMEDIRITTGDARYTSSFSPPTASLPVTTEVTDGEGGLVWIKDRTGATNHSLVDSERGVDYWLRSNTTGAQISFSGNSLTPMSFNSNGFTTSDYGEQGYIGNHFTSWTFRKAPKFFDVVTWTGTANQTIAHSLGVEPGMIIVKRTGASEDWWVYHRSATNSLKLNSTAAELTFSVISSVTSTSFNVSLNTTSGSDGYVAYLFAHNDGDGGFGADGDADIIKCGSYTNSGSAWSVDLGFEPQWILRKLSNGISSWELTDNMRGLLADNGSGTAYARLLKAESSNAENNAAGINITSTGIEGTGSGDTGTWIYIAIRRGTKVPESGTEVFQAASRDTTGGVEYYSGWPVDFIISPFGTNTTHANFTRDRIRGGNYLKTELTDAELTGTYFFDSNVGYRPGSFTPASQYFSWMWKRAPGYFDSVAYTGDSPGGVGTQTIQHNLGVAPEMIWFKRRDSTGGWGVLNTHLPTVSNLGQGAYINDTSAFAASGWWGSPYSAPTASSFLVRGSTPNASGGDYIAYLFASLDGISKVGSVTHSGTTNVDCGFSSGARFILLKRTDASGDWYVWDSERGIVSGNDPYLLLNTTAAEVTNTDYIDPLSSGFTITSNFTAGDYIFYAIA